MNRSETEYRLRSLISELSGLDGSGVGLDDDLMECLDLDSLAALRLLAAVETVFEVRFNDAELAGLRSLRRLLSALRQREPQEVIL